jgi:hypothetical protein
MELRKIDRSAPWGVPGRRPWVAVWFQECNVPVFGFRGVAAKSFVLRRCSNFIFSRPHKLFRRAIYFPSKDAAGAQSAEARHSRPTKTLATSPLDQYLGFCRYKMPFRVVSVGVMKLFSELVSKRAGTKPESSSARYSLRRVGV